MLCSPIGLCYALPPPTSDQSVMRNLYYQGKFCAECGSALDRRSVWRTRYLCDHCDGVLGRRFERRRRRTLAAVLLIVILLFPGDRQSGIDRSAPRPETAPAVTNQISEESPNDLLDNTKLTLCGARTKKGTPCRRRVSPGRRCYQHQDQPSILAPSATEK